METAVITGNIEYAIRVCMAMDRKFTDADLRSLRFGNRVVDVETLKNGAFDYVENYTGSFEYMVQLKHQTRTLSLGQLRGALNCLRADLIREEREAEAKASQPKQMELPAASGSQPAEGRYTVEWEDGSWTTLRLRLHWDEKMAARGTMVVGYLRGQDNETSYTGFGTVDARGQFRLWGKYDPSKLARQIDAVRVLLGGKAEEAREAFALREGKCSRCGRTLTVPASLHRGLGPECAKHV